MLDIAIRAEQGNFTYRAGAIIVEHGKLLMVRDRIYPGYYTPGGKVRLGETSEEGIIREVFEETGLVYAVERLLYVQERFFTLEGRLHHELAMYYRMKPTGDDRIAENSATDQVDVETLHWLPLDQLARYPLVPDFLREKPLDNLSVEHILEDQR